MAVSGAIERLLVPLRHRQPRRARAENETCGGGDIVVVDLNSPCQHGTPPRGAHGEYRRPRRIDAEGEGGRTQGIDRGGGNGCRLAFRPCCAKRDGLGRGSSVILRRCRCSRQVQPQPTPFAQRGRDRLVALAFVEQNEAHAAIDRRCQPSRQRGVDAFGHRDDQRPPGNLGQQTACGDRTTGGERSGQVDPAEQPVIVDPKRKAQHRPRRRRTIRRDPRIAHRTGGRAHNRAAKASIGGQKARGEEGVRHGA